MYQTERELQLYMHFNGKHSKERRKIVSFPFVVIVLSTHCKMMTDTVKEIYSSVKMKYMNRGNKQRGLMSPFVLKEGPQKKDPCLRPF